ncbi:DUF882 domain-containing protein [Bradyrhizobium sp.]|uniref:DUF882 domain-containing protein n=1 Tax=Bradyrhizobium sp. TaxID=376 RepID=UPI001EBCC591|nr:DUF882 domain-containing protein [Bradyrhizobium sp.]MBV9981919.1 DUF882 domain-containing protein [Bradyrhizobium sp.]
MLAGFARRLIALSLSRAGRPGGAVRLGVAGTLLLLGAGSVHDATAENETRTLSFHHTHSDEDLTVTFKRNGRYDEEALKKLNHYLRDWRTQDETVMDRHLFDILWEVYRDVDGKQPIQIVSSYRSPATNAMLRHRSAHSGVARYSQHMLGHAMDFYIPNVPLEQIRFAGLRLQRGGVGFYPTSGSPFVHLDTGSIRHWPRMTHDQLARVFPDGRTVHVPSDGVPLKGYELARAEIEKRGDGDNAGSLPTPGNFFAALFRGKQSEEDDEVANAADGNDKPASAPVKMADAKAGPVPTPRAKPQIATTLQLASADVQAVQPAKPKPAAPVADKPDTDSEATPRTPADIINARGFWGELAAAPKQATPGQIAALNARRALASVDPPQSPPNASSAYQAFAYAPLSSPPVDRANVVAASAPMPRNVRLAQAERNSAPATDINTVAAKGSQDQRPQDRNGPVATSTRLAAGSGNETWMRIMLLAPSAATMSVTIFGDTDLSGMRQFFIKPQTAIAMGFSADPMMGLTCDQFSGSAVAKLETTSLKTAVIQR